MQSVKVLILIPVFVPFPGYDNLNERGEIISLEKSSGKSDTYNTVSDVSGFESARS